MARRGSSLKLWRAAGGGLCTTSCQDMYVLTGDALGRVCRSDASPQVWSKRRHVHVGRCRCITRPRSMGYVARTDTLELYVHECRQVLWTVSNRERVARRRAACHLSDAGAQALGQVKVVGAVSVVVLTFLLTVRELPALGPIRIEPRRAAEAYAWDTWRRRATRTCRKMSVPRGPPPLRPRRPARGRLC